MIKSTQLISKFVDYIPEDAQIEDGTLYISKKFLTATHKCCCGCGLKVVTPLNPTGWQLTSNDEGVSLFPSIGNWSIPCQSHYIIENSQVRWAKNWSPAQIAAGRLRDRKNRERYFATRKNSKYLRWGIITLIAIGLLAYLVS